MARYFQDPAHAVQAGSHAQTSVSTQTDDHSFVHSVQNPGNLATDRGREREHIDFLGTQQRAFRKAVRLERRTYES